MRIEDDNGISALLIGTESRLATGFGFTEGPTWVPQDDALVFSDIPGNRMHRWRAGASTAEVWREGSGWANGTTMDAQGRILACEHGGRRVSRSPYDQPEVTTTLASHWEGKALNSPNDLVVHSSGAIFFTDPSYGIESGRIPRFGTQGQAAELDFKGVYRIDTDGSLHLAVPTDAYNMPNGLAFSPDESVLYIGDSGNKQIWRHEVNADLSLRKGTLFVDQTTDTRRGVPDGMKVDTDGRLWTTGTGGVSVHTPEGEYLGVFELDEEHAANITFGGRDFSTLFLTAMTSIYSVQTTVRGIGPGSR